MIELAQEERPKRTPYTTPSGLQIGSRYEPPPQNPNSREDDFWQGILLGDPPEWTLQRVVSTVIHTVILIVLVGLGIHFGG